MPISKLPAHLVTRLGKKECSICGLGFAKDVKPSLSKAFAEHVREVHSTKKEAKSSDTERRR